MKKIVILSMLMLVMVSTSSAQDSCIVRPSCADMGYTKTESECSGKTTLKCPFDLSAVSCEEGTQTINSLTPLLDWNNLVLAKDFKTQITIQEGATTSGYTAPEDGCFLSSGSTYIIRPWGRSISIDQQTLLCVSKGMTISGYIDYFVPYINTNTEIKTSDNCEIGDFYFSDNSCSSSSQIGKDIIGVVVDSDNRLLASPIVFDSLFLHWSSGTRTLIGASSQTNGKENTDKLKNYSQTSGNSFPAAERCYNLTTGGTTWYLPSSVEITKIDNVIPKISLYKTIFWTSTEVDRNSVKAYFVDDDLSTSLSQETKSSYSGGDLGINGFSLVCFANY